MKPRRLQSATIFSMVTTSDAAVCSSVAMRWRLDDGPARTNPLAPRKQRRNSRAAGCPDFRYLHRLESVSRPISRVLWDQLRLTAGRPEMIDIALRATSHVAAWLIWHSTGVSLLADLD